MSGERHTDLQNRIASVEVVDTDDVLTKEELHHLKKMVKYYSTGQIIVGIFITLGALAIGAIHIWDFIQKRWLA